VRTFCWAARRCHEASSSRSTSAGTSIASRACTSAHVTTDGSDDVGRAVRSRPAAAGASIHVTAEGPSNLRAPVRAQRVARARARGRGGAGRRPLALPQLRATLRLHALPHEDGGAVLGHAVPLLACARVELERHAQRRDLARLRVYGEVPVRDLEELVAVAEHPGRVPEAMDLRRAALEDPAEVELGLRTAGVRGRAEVHHRGLGGLRDAAAVQRHNAEVEECVGVPALRRLLHPPRRLVLVLARHAGPLKPQHRHLELRRGVASAGRLRQPDCRILDALRLAHPVEVAHPEHVLRLAVLLLRLEPRGVWWHREPLGLLVLFLLGLRLRLVQR